MRGRSCLGCSVAIVICGSTAWAGCSNDADDCQLNATCTPYVGAGSGGTSGTSDAGGTTGSGGAAGTGGTGGDATSCDPSKSPSEDTCIVDEAYGIFVSPNGNDTTGDGSRAKPFQTISKGIGAAVSGKKRRFRLRRPRQLQRERQRRRSERRASDVRGFSCADWTYSTTSKSKIASPAPTAFTVSALAQGLRVEDFEVAAANAASAGGSSIGAVVGNSKKVVFRRVKITAGKGAAGGPGTAASVRAQAGATGNNGRPACAADPNQGGTAVTTQCNGAASVSIGGRGGDGGKGTSSAGSGDEGLPNLGIGGAGVGELSGTWACGSSGAGQAGNNGSRRQPRQGRNRSRYFERERLFTSRCHRGWRW